MLLAVLLVLIGLALSINWLNGGRKNIMLRNLGVIILGLGLLMSIFGLYLYFNPY